MSVGNMGARKGPALLPGENVEWAGRRGLSFWVPLGMFLGIGGLLLAIVSVEGSPTLGLVVVALVLAGFVYLIYQYIVQTRWTKYFLTNMRLLETRRGTIVREVPLTRFMEKPLSQYLYKEVSYLKNDQPIYKVRVIDPVSAEVLMEFKDLNERVAEILGKMGQVVRCSYCGTKNSASSLRCNFCGGSL